MRRVQAIALPIALSWVSVASARPSHSELDEVLATSPDIVVAEVVQSGETARLRITDALRGELSGEVVPALGLGHPHIPVGTTVVAFLDQERAWTVYATPTNVPDVWRVTGFDDLNTHVVDRNVVSWQQLQTLIAGGTATWRFTGSVYGSDGPTAQVLDVTLGRPSRVNLGAPAGLGAPIVTLSPWDSSDVDVQFRVPSGRSLSLEGRIIGLEEDAFTVRWRVTAPDALTAADIEQFWTDGGAVDWQHHVAVVWSDGEVWPGTLDSHLRLHTPSNGVATSEDVRFDPRWPSYMTFAHRTDTCSDCSFRWSMDGPHGPRPPGMEHGFRYLLSELTRGPMLVEVAEGTTEGRWGALVLGASGAHLDSRRP